MLYNTWCVCIHVHRTCTYVQVHVHLNYMYMYAFTGSVVGGTDGGFEECSDTTSTGDS